MSYILPILISELIDISITLIHLYKTITLVILYYNFILHPSTYLCINLPPPSHPFYKPSPVYHLPYQMCLDPELIVVSSKCHNVFLYIIILPPSRQFHKSHTDVNSWPLPNMAGNERHVFSSEKWKLVKKTTVWCSFSWQQTDSCYIHNMYSTHTYRLELNQVPLYLWYFYVLLFLGRYIFLKVHSRSIND